MESFEVGERLSSSCGLLVHELNFPLVPNLASFTLALYACIHSSIMSRVTEANKDAITMIRTYYKSQWVLFGEKVQWLVIRGLWRLKSKDLPS